MIQFQTVNPQVSQYSTYLILLDFYIPIHRCMYVPIHNEHYSGLLLYYSFYINGFLLVD